LVKPFGLLVLLS